MKGPILIQGAMDVETRWLVSQLEACTEWVLGGFRFWSGQCRGLELVVSQTEIGTICAACATALGIETFAPQVVINQGVAGAHWEELQVGDIVVGESCIHIHDLQTPARSRGEGCAPFEWEYHDHAEGETPRYYPSASQWRDRFARAPYKGGQKRVGVLGSGDVFNREHDRILWLREWAGQLCEDMESIAAYQVCHRFQVPCVGVRIISNNELTGQTYQREVGLVLQKFILATLD